MTYYEAAIQVLRSAGRPLSAQEITNEAVERGLLPPGRKTPDASMRAMLYTSIAHKDSKLIKFEEPGGTRAKRGSVCWTLRHVPAAD